MIRDPVNHHTPVKSRLLLLLVCCALAAAGCALPGLANYAVPGPVSNPLLVACRNEHDLWERSVDVLHELQFDIGRENRLGHVIETVPKTGASLLEPWHKDSVSLASRWESTLQSIRRTVQLQFQPDDNGNGFLVSVVVLKELEDLPGVAGNSAGAATFSESQPLERDLNPVVGQSTPSQWIPVGRDAELEQVILQRLSVAYSL